jgi:hypothetical protein
MAGGKTEPPNICPRRTGKKASPFPARNCLIHQIAEGSVFETRYGNRSRWKLALKILAPATVEAQNPPGTSTRERIHSAKKAMTAKKQQQCQYRHTNQRHFTRLTKIRS